MNGPAPLFDEALLAELRAGLSDEDFRAVFALLPDAVREQWDAVRAALDGGDREAAAGAAHALKGMAASVGAVHLAESARAVEHGADDPAVLAALQHAVTATLAAMHALGTQNKKP